MSIEARPRRLAIFGTGGHARECGWIAAAAGWEIAAYLERSGSATEPLPTDAPVEEEEAFFATTAEPTQAHIGVGDVAVRRAIAARFADRCAWRSLIHPAATLAPSAIIGAGAAIFPLASISVDARLGAHVLVNVGASLSHDASIGDFATIGPGARVAGCVEIGEGATIGVGASVKNGAPGRPLRIGAGATIGAGAVVVSDIPDGAVAVGTPAKPLRSS